MALIQKTSWIRTVYLYLFSLLGLVLIIIGTVKLFDLGLKIFIFKHADEAETLRQAPPFPPERFVESMPDSKQPSGEIKLSDTEKITSDEKAALERWVMEYNDWQEGLSKIDYLRSRREREASNALAFIIVGLPLYLYHWRMIKRDKREERTEFV